MRRLLLLLLSTCVTPVSAQVVPPELALTADAAASIVAFYNHPETIRLNGDSRVAAGTELDGNVAVLEGTLTLAGRIRGQLIVINGDLDVRPGAQVDGTVTVVGGNLHGADSLRAAGIAVYRERLKYELRESLLLLMREVQIDELTAGREFGFGRTDLLIAARGGYNRSEGLPVHVGPRLTLGQRNPTLLEGL
ncbi:MAG: hypothetical protein ACT443_05420, partial [Gemmatimonadota bacterium]